MKKIFCLFAVLVSSLLVNAQNIPIIPTPQQVELKSGSFQWTENTLLYLENNTPEDVFAVENLNQVVSRVFGQVNKRVNNKKELNISNTLIKFERTDNLNVPKFKEQASIIEISPKTILVKYSTSTGLFYAVQSLKQLLLNGEKIQCMTIVDYPAMQYRGWLDDISRGPIPTMEYLKKVIVKFSEYKMNFFNLYTEHTFKSQFYPDIAPQDGLTVSEILELTDFAKQYHVEFFGNQQCFAHAEKTLRIPFYDKLIDTRYNFNPAVNDTYKFLENLFSEIAPAYESQFFNINCDETESLGSGRSKEYVEKFGSSNAYSMHINKVNDILKKYNKKRVMMWGDIAVKHPEIIDSLPDDLIIIAWSYVDSDTFNDLILPFKNSGFDFMIAPGVSMWGSVYPSIKTYIKNIAYFVRDGYKNGALGMMNTAWDDSGDPLFNNAWHAMIWAAEMSWKPIENIDTALAQIECNIREISFNEIFAKQFFGDNRTEILSKLYELDNFSELPVENMMEFAALGESLFDFYPPKLDETAFKNYSLVFEKSLKMYNDLTDISLTLENKQSVDMISSAALSAFRIMCTAQKNLLRIQLYKVIQTKDIDEINKAKQMSENLFENIYLLKKMYLKCWDMENRAYWRDINLAKYDKIAEEILQIPYHVFIDVSLNKDNRQIVRLYSIYNDKKIYYTTNGQMPTSYSNLFLEPFEIKQSTIVKAVIYNDINESFYSEKFILSHKGIGHLKKLNCLYSTYNAAYSAGGDNGMFDGLTGSNDFRDGFWQGYQGQNIDVELSWAEKTEIKSVSMRFLESAHDWILSPTIIEIYSSKNGKDFCLVKSLSLIESWQTGRKIIPVDIDLSESKLKTQYLRIVAKNPGVLPQWHHAAGAESFLFIDEIVVL